MGAQVKKSRGSEILWVVEEKERVAKYFSFSNTFQTKMCLGDPRVCVVLKTALEGGVFLVRPPHMCKVILLGREVQILFSGRGIVKICSGRGRNCFI